jgi:hypothetical protein
VKPRAEVVEAFKGKLDKKKLFDAAKGESSGREQG